MPPNGIAQRAKTNRTKKKPNWVETAVLLGRRLHERAAIAAALDGINLPDFALQAVQEKLIRASSRREAARKAWANRRAKSRAKARRKK